MLPRRGTPRLYDLVKLHSDTPSTTGLDRLLILNILHAIITIETRHATLVSQKKFNNPKNAKIRLNKWHFAKIKKRGFIVLPDSFQWFVKPCQQVCHIHFLGE